MKYLYDVPFSTGPASQAYRDGWDAVFSHKADEFPKTETQPNNGPCPCESGKPFAECHGAAPADE